MPPKPSEAGASKARKPAAGRAARTTHTNEAGDAAEAVQHTHGAAPVNLKLPPVSSPAAMFEDMVRHLKGDDMDKLCGVGYNLTVATLCSGSDAPIFALRNLEQALGAAVVSPNNKIGEKPFGFSHLYSCEIEPFKQGFIRRNLPAGTLIFRDVLEMALATNGDGKAMTSGGFKAEIPKERPDILFSGCSCVDYSQLNNRLSSADLKIDSLDKHMNEKGMVDIRLDGEFVRDLDAALPLLRLRNTGESARTFFAAMKLFLESRPRAIILENVDGAPWDVYTRVLFPKIGYAARFVKVDSKDYYLPHTRNRGYLVAIDALEIGADRAKDIADEWPAIMESLERGASSPVTDFLSHREDPIAIRARAQLAAAARPNDKEPEWLYSMLRHIAVRNRRGLSDRDNPFSQKEMRCGRITSYRYPMDSWPEFWTKQPARVVDLVDIAIASGLKAKIDFRFKTFVIDASQNVDRCSILRYQQIKDADKERTNAGTIGCITPKGLFIITDQMRPLTGIEAMALQGMPVDDITVSTEKQSELLDLAGNAMTVPVVGAATLALLVASLRVKPRISKTSVATSSSAPLPLPNPIGDPDLDFSPDNAPLFAPLFNTKSTRAMAPQTDGLRDKPMWTSAPGLAEARTPTDLTSEFSGLCTIVTRARRLCFCRTTYVVPSDSREKWLVCQDCGANACTSCESNPKHNFQPASTVPGLQEPYPTSSIDCATVELAEHVPLMIHWKLPADYVDKCLGSSRAKPAYRALVQAVLQAPTYHFDKIMVGEVTTVFYKAIESNARLVLQGDSAMLYIFIGGDFAEREKLFGLVKSEFDAYRLIAHPIARINLRTQASDGVKVYLRDPTRCNLKITMDWQEDPRAVLVKGLTLPQHVTVAPSAAFTAHIAQIEAQVKGVYYRRKDCGTPRDMLHVKASQDNGQPRLFILEDTTKIGNLAHDGFAWTTDKRKIDTHEYREVLLRLNPRIKMDSPEPFNAPVDAFLDGLWVECDPSPLTDSLTHEETHPLELVPKSVLEAAGCHEDCRKPESAAMDPCMLVEISTDLPDFPLPWSTTYLYRSDNMDETGGRCFSRTVPREQRDSFLKLFSRVTAGLQQSRIPPYERSEGDMSHFHGDWIPVKHCEQAVLVPTALFYSAVDNKLVEIPQEAGVFENLHRNLPQAIRISARLERELGYRSQYNEGTTIDDRVRYCAMLLLEMFPSVLPSRALSFLRQAHPTPALGSKALNDHVKTAFKLQLSYKPPVHPVFEVPLTAVTECATANMEGIDVGRAPIILNRLAYKDRFFQPLRADQVPALDWMFLREHCPIPFIKREQEEDVISGLNLRVAGQAEWETDFPYSARGGVVAHEIGYGKTVVMLALIAAQWTHDETYSVAERQNRLDSLWKASLPPNPIPGSRGKKGLTRFFHHLPGTLAIVPSHITTQWKTEAQNYLGLTAEQLLVFTKVQDIGRTPLAKLKKARLIILSSAAFSDPKYMRQLEAISGRNDAGDFRRLSDRALRNLHRGAIMNTRIVLAHYLDRTSRGEESEHVIEHINSVLIPALQEQTMGQIGQYEAERAATKFAGRVGYKNGQSEVEAAQNVDEDVEGGVSAPAPAPAPKTKGKGKGKKAEAKADKEVEPAPKDKGRAKKAEAKTNEESEPAPKAAPKAKAKPSAIGWDVTGLNNLSFARIIWDEYAYDDQQVAVFVEQAAAYSKWLLSGTPPASSLKDVCAAAAKFGVHIARAEPQVTDGLPPQAVGIVYGAGETSPPEKVQSAAHTLKSIDFSLERQKQAILFVQQFYRSNKVEDKTVEIKYYKVPSRMPAVSAVQRFISQAEMKGDDYYNMISHVRELVDITPELRGNSGRGNAGREDGQREKAGRDMAHAFSTMFDCGLDVAHRQGRTVEDLEDSFRDSRDALERHTKLLFDKMMWLKLWIAPYVQAAKEAKKWQESLEEAIVHPTAWVMRMAKAWEKQDFTSFGGEDMFIRDVAVFTRRFPPESTATSAEVGAAVGACERHLHSRVLLYTWIDFYDLDPHHLNGMGKEKLTFLARDLIYLKYRHDRDAPHLNSSTEAVAFMRAALSEAGRDNRVHRPNINELAESDLRKLGGWSNHNLRVYISAWVRAKPQRPNGPDPAGDSMGKTELQDWCRRKNLKFAPSAGAKKLRELRLQFLHGRLGVGHFRDARAPVDLHTDFPIQSKARPVAAEEEEEEEEVDDPVGPYLEELKDATAQLHKTWPDLKAARGEYRFVCQFADLLDQPMHYSEDRLFVAQHGEEHHECDKCGKELDADKNPALFVSCGHMVCSTCQIKMIKGMCNVDQCTTAVAGHPVVNGGKIRPTAFADHNRPEMIAGLIENDIPEDDKVLVFSQYPTMLAALSEEFRARGFGFTNMAGIPDNDPRQPKFVEKFKSGQGGKVMLMDIESETSAGTNLPIANHVIFATSLEHLDDAQRTLHQAIGRAARWGQRKPVYVYFCEKMGSLEVEDWPTKKDAQKNSQENSQENPREDGSDEEMDEDSGEDVIMTDA
ncbi:hypothetical protein B0H67DRAFT_556266 [Lasiosphaeris hirsuta]|uniref:Helicase C-terminal domain-containing protein n=1 Tax=Lasiosphaeris hirsuta TaxID=260670 RepID=A0AA40A1I3_9PEZI|nr:hypothetical protein B0H67DRAFT_556266 [Lasiosphaeris hirsuta]